MRRRFFFFAATPSSSPSPLSTTHYDKPKKQTKTTATQCAILIHYLERPAGLFDHVDGVEVGAPLEAQHRVDRQLGKVLLLPREDLGREGRARDVGQVRAQRGGVAGVVEAAAGQRGLGRLRRLAVARDDRGRVDLGGDEELGLAQELAREDDDRGRAVADLVVLDAGDVCFFIFFFIFWGGRRGA